MRRLARVPALSPDALAHLNAYARQARAANTLRAFATQWHAFDRWCHRQGCPSLPAAPISVAAYLAARAHAGAAVSTINTALAAIVFAHKAARQPFERWHADLDVVLAGIRRANVRPQRQAEPLTGNLLGSVLAGLSSSSLDLRDGALLALAYTFALRRSEVTALDWMRRGRGRGWLSLTATQAELVLIGSKAAQGNVERLLVPSHACPRALEAIERWVAYARIAPGEPLLRPLTRGGRVRQQRLQPASVNAIVKCAMHRHFLRPGLAPEAAAERAALFSGHSGRVGLYVSSTQAGVPPQHIAALARHRNLAMARRYSERADMLTCAPHLATGVGV